MKIATCDPILCTVWWCFGNWTEGWT